MVCEKNEKNSPVWKLRALDHARRRAGAVVMGDTALQDPAQHMMLVNVSKMSESGSLPSQRELARAMHLSPATVTATLKLLERDGYVRRIPDADDQRINRVALTESGEALMREGMRRLDVLESVMLEGLSPEEQDTLCQCLSKMRTNLLRYIKSTEVNAHG